MNKASNYRVNIDRLRGAGVDVNTVVGRVVGSGFATLTQSEMDAIGCEIARLARIRNMMDVIEMEAN